MKKMKLSAYQLKGVDQIWFKQLKEGRAVVTGPLDREKFKVSFLDRFFSLEIGKQTFLIHQPSLSKYKCEGICFEVHTIV